MFERWLVLWLCAICLAAFLWPAQLWDPFVFTAPYLSPLFAATMFMVGWLLPRDELTNVLRRGHTVLAGTAIQFSVMPLLAYAAVQLFRFEGGLAAGIILVGCVPGAMASNVLTLLARGNLSYSLSLTTTATLLSPLVVPFALRWILDAQVGSGVGPDVIAIFKTLVTTLVIPVLAGHVTARFVPRASRWVEQFGPALANLTILWIIAVVVAVNRDKLTDVTPRLATALLFVNSGGYLAGYVGAHLIRITPRMRRALTLEIGMQNAGLGAVLAMEFEFAGPTSAIVPALYTFGCMLTGTALARFWSTRPVEAT